MEIVNIKVSSLRPYEKNAKKHDQTQIDNVAKSIEKYGFVQPLVIDKNNVVIIGHCRLEASKKLKLKEVPCVLADTLTDEQVKELRLLDNKLNESEWDLDLISEELADIDLSDFELDWDVSSFGENLPNTDSENPYTMKVDIPQYQITGECPELSELTNEDKQKELLKDIKASNLAKEQKEFLIKASQRHVVFDYGKIAEYYAHQDKEMQGLMEKSALVIIDFNDAIKNGFVEVRKTIEDLVGDIDEE